MISRQRIEEVFGSCSKAKAAQLAQRIELAKLIIKRLNTGRVIHYDNPILLDAASKLLNGKGLNVKEHAAWNRYKDLI